MKMKKQILLLASILLLPLHLLFAQGTQTVRGRILDEASKAPVIGASVILVRPEGPLLGTAADLDGHFKLTQVPLGRQTFQVKAIGYESRMLANVIVTAGKEVVLNIVLTEGVQVLNEAVVTAKRSENKLVTNNEMALISGRSFNVDDTKRYAGALGDPARMAANFAGVIAGNDSRNDIVVRGNSPSGMLWQMEGLNIPNPNHFGSLTSTGGPVSILNNNNLAKSDFLTSAFPAQYGNGLSGVFDLSLRNGNDEKREYLGQVGFNGFEVGAEGPFSKTNPKKGSFLFNYRYSTLGVFNKLGIQFGTGNAVPNYQDVNFKVNLPLSSKVTLSAFGMGGLSDVNFEGNKEDTTGKNLYGSENENTRVDYGTGIAGVSVDIQTSSRSNLKLTTGVSATKENFEGDSISTETRQAFLSGKARFRTQKYSFNGQYVHKINARNSLNAGFYNDLYSFNLFNKNVYEGGQREVINVNRDGNWYLGQAYLQWKHRFSNRLSVTPGLHAQYTTQGSAFAIEPRIGAKYNLTENQSINVGYGLHHQMQSAYTYSVESRRADGSIELSNKDLGFTRSQHFVLGTERMLTSNTTLKAEVYYQFIDKAPVTNSANPGSYSALNSGNSFAPDDEANLVNKGLGENYGIEVTLERSFTNGFYYLLTGSLFDSKYKGSDGVWRNTAFNTGYAANALIGKEWKIGKEKQNVLAFNIKVSAIGGRYLTPIDEMKSREQEQAVFDKANAFSQQQSEYFRTDIKLSYRREYKKSTLEFSLDLQNVTDHQNVFTRQYNRRTNSIVTQYQQGFFPVPFTRFTF
jgi:hypothetical protein